MKNILLIAPSFYGYDIEIKNELSRRDYQVTLVNLDINNLLVSIIVKILKRIFPKLERLVYWSYFNIRLEKINKKFDKLIVISGETIDKKILLNIKNKYMFSNMSRAILYIWTPISRYPQIKDTLAIYSKVFSFEYEDCKKYNLEFLPNFYSSKMKKIDILEEDDIFFVGQYRKERYKLKKELEKLGIKTNIKLYHNKYFYFLFKVLKWKEYKKLRTKDFIFEPLTREEVNYYMNRAKCILDIVDLNQHGLTQRIFDGLILNKKIVTTNLKIKNYDFFSEDNIFILDIMKKPEQMELQNFLRQKLKKAKNKSYIKYSLENWINILLEEKWY